VNQRQKMSADLEIKVNNTLSELQRVNEALTEFSRRHGLSAKVAHDLNLALEEILTNVISYGYTDNGEHEIRVRLTARTGEITAEVQDDGRPFNPLTAPEPDITKPVDDRAVGGLGIHLVRKLMDGLEYKRQGDRNFLIMKKRTEKV
jgi:anti-sigma regulatory factor (Ser/Thr protein kinase)